MKLSVIIVSYNVKYFLEKCIVSVERAMRDYHGEIIVVDNNSHDRSAEMVQSLFPAVKLIANQDNKGFARACNQGIRIAKGEYVLLLNPDTLVSEVTFSTCITFMDAHPDASACGVRMVDGTGTFLPESMRGLPGPLSAFFKMTGLHTLFPHSKFFNGYYAGAPDPEKQHAIPVLSGAFMFLRTSVLHEVGFLDEDYFMYGEDIDLSYRMVKAGYQNYYVPNASIIHYKGESTERGSLKYVMHFYRAMLIYVSKHMQGAGGWFFKAMIMVAVSLRAIAGGIKRFVLRALPVFLDVVVLAGSCLLMKDLWAKEYFGDAAHFDRAFSSVNLPLYVCLWILFLFLCGAHDQQRSVRRIMYGMITGTMAVLLVYAILPLEYRSSRAVIFLTAGVASLILIALTFVLQTFRKKIRERRRIVIVGSMREVNRVMELMTRAEAERTIAGWITTQQEDEGPMLLGHIDHVDELVRRYQVGELILSSKDLSYQEINALMTRLGPSLAYRISSSDSGEIVGSDSKRSQGTLYTANVEFALAYPAHRRSKRIFDVISACILLLLWPLVAVFRRNSGKKLKSIVDVFSGKKTWVGYQMNDHEIGDLPKLKPGIVPVSGAGHFGLDVNAVHMKNYIYAREYSVWKDIDLLLKHITQVV